MTGGRIDNSEDFRVRVAPALAVIDGLTFHSIEVDHMLDPREVTLRYRGSATMSSTGKPYEQTYITQIRVDLGKVVRFREYYDRAILAAAMTP